MHGGATTQPIELICGIFKDLVELELINCANFCVYLLRDLAYRWISNHDCVHLESIITLTKLASVSSTVKLISMFYTFEVSAQVRCIYFIASFMTHKEFNFNESVNFQSMPYLVNTGMLETHPRNPVAAAVTPGLLSAQQLRF